MTEHDQAKSYPTTDMLAARQRQAREDLYRRQQHEMDRRTARQTRTEQQATRR